MARAGDARADRLEAWSKEHGKITREPDWRKVALDLFDAAAGPVHQAHVDALVKAYREGMKGGRTIMLVQRVADEVFDWQKQDAPTLAAMALVEPPAARPAPAPRVVEQMALRSPLSDPPARPSSRPSAPASAPAPAPASVAPVAADLEFDPFAHGVAADPPKAELADDPIAPYRRSAASPSVRPQSVRPASMRPASMRPAGAAAPPLAALDVPVMAPGAPRSGRGPLLIVMVVVVAILGLAGYFVLQSSLFAKTNAMVKGAFVSEHLGLSVKFDEPWLHDESLDDSEKKDSWTRRVSIFYHGSSANDFSAQVTLITFSRDGAEAGASDAAQLGANETLGMAFDRKCNPYKHAAGGQGVECSAVSTFGGRRYACFETYFNVGDKAAFARVLMEIPPLPVGPDGARDFEEQMTRNAADAALIVSSVRALPK